MAAFLDKSFPPGIQERLKELDTSLQAESFNRGFPLDIWQRLGVQGLLSDYQFASYQDIASAGYNLIQYCSHPGLAMTWVGQLLKAGFLTRAANTTLIGTCLKQIIAGEALCALAISEPKVGAHPKHLSCTATASADGFILNGEKAYVSHGPYADWLVVLAITGEHQGRKAYSAFLVHRGTEGLEFGPVADAANLGPSQHCNVKFNRCRLAKAALLGEPGTAFEQISRPMRTLEDVLMLAPIASAMQRQLDLVTEQIKPTMDRDTLGLCLGLTESAAELGILAASKLDHSIDHGQLTPLIVGTRALINEVQGYLRPWRHGRTRLAVLCEDIAVLNGIGQSATQLRMRSLVNRRFQLTN